MSNIIEVKKLSKSFGKGKNRIEILKEVDLAIKEGEDLAIVGASGCGKTTFLQILGLLDKATSGEILFSGKNIAKSNDKIRTNYLKKDIGFIYQFHHLMPEFTALENVIMPLLINGVKKAEAEKEGLKILDGLGIKNRASHRPNALSGGEKQRVAIARGMIHKPAILLADEPTGNLDPANANQVFDLFLAELKKRKQTTIIVTHNLELAKKLSKAITIKDGKVKKL